MDFNDEAMQQGDAYEGHEAVHQQLNAEQKAQAQSFQRQIDQLTRQMGDVIAGTHPDIVEKAEVLKRLKRRREEAARVHYTHLEANAKGLAEFEKLNAAAALQTDLDTLKETLLDTVAQEIRRIEEEVRRAFDPSPPAVPAHVLGAAAPGSANKRYNKRPPKFKHTAAKEAAGKVIAALPKPVLPDCVQLSLTDLEMRTDFASIIQDLQQRTLAYLQLCGNSQQAAVSFDPDHRGLPAVRVQGTLYKIGDRVIVWSRTTAEEFRGEITEVKMPSKEVYIRLVGNVPVRIHGDHLQSGRLVLKKEKSSNMLNYS